mmetsp:Transcript_8536/g.11792  ORF Transcript_8536/g.11792 Transcript_8536/m.11792 type:complete len:215 (-) Transcript_8536:315-959(-)
MLIMIPWEMLVTCALMTSSTTKTLTIIAEISITAPLCTIQNSLIRILMARVMLVTTANTKPTLTKLIRTVMALETPATTALTTSTRFKRTMMEMELVMLVTVSTPPRREPREQPDLQREPLDREHQPLDLPILQLLQLVEAATAPRELITALVEPEEPEALEELREPLEPLPPELLEAPRRELTTAQTISHALLAALTSSADGVTLEKPTGGLV